MEERKGGGKKTGKVLLECFPAPTALGSAGTNTNTKGNGQLPPLTLRVLGSTKAALTRLLSPATTAPLPLSLSSTLLSTSLLSSSYPEILQLNIALPFIQTCSYPKESDGPQTILINGIVNKGRSRRMPNVNHTSH